MNWCPTHKTYSAKREPNSLCGNCWQLWGYRNPEWKYDSMRISMELLEAYKKHRREKNLVSQASKPPRKG